MGKIPRNLLIQPGMKLMRAQVLNLSTTTEYLKYWACLNLCEPASVLDNGQMRWGLGSVYYGVWESSLLSYYITAPKIRIMQNPVSHTSVENSVARILSTYFSLVDQISIHLMCISPAHLVYWALLKFFELFWGKIGCHTPNVNHFHHLDPILVYSRQELYSPFSGQCLKHGMTVFSKKNASCPQSLLTKVLYFCCIGERGKHTVIIFAKDPVPSKAAIFHFGTSSLCETRETMLYNTNTSGVRAI